MSEKRSSTSVIILYPLIGFGRLHQRAHRLRPGHTCASIGFGHLPGNVGVVVWRNRMLLMSVTVGLYNAVNVCEGCVVTRTPPRVLELFWVSELFGVLEVVCAGAVCV